MIAIAKLLLLLFSIFDLNSLQYWMICESDETLRYIQLKLKPFGGKVQHQNLSIANPIFVTCETFSLTPSLMCVSLGLIIMQPLFLFYFIFWGFIIVYRLNCILLEQLQQEEPN